MLKNKIISFNFHRFVQSGLYIDFFFKKIIESYIRNSLIYSSQFFGEKYIIEFLTKKLIDSIIFNNNNFFFFLNLSYSNFFLQIIFLVFYFLTLINLILWIF